MPYQIVHISTNPEPVNQTPTFVGRNATIQKWLIKLGLIKEYTAPEGQEVKFSHSLISPVKIQDIVKDQVGLLRMNKLQPLCIFIGSKDYVDLCEYADLHLIEQVSYVESVKLLEDFHRTVPTLDSESLNEKIFEIVCRETDDYVNKKIKRMPGSLIVSGYKFLNLPLVILPWLSGVFVSPNLDAEPNTTII